MNAQGSAEGTKPPRAIRPLPMRRALPLLAPLALAAAPAPAHAPHGGCADGETVVSGGLVHVDQHGGRCADPPVGTRLVQRALHHDHPQNVAHAHVARGSRSESGVISPYSILA